MLKYLLFIIVCLLVAYLSRRLALAIFVIGVCGFLYVLPSTELDYEYYRQAYENARWTTDFPWFATKAVLTAEPAYLWYSSAMSVLTGLNFQGYLVVNFLLCFAISAIAFRDAGVDRFALYWLCWGPVALPTLFYYSPRSSVSFFLVLLGISLAIRRQWWLGSAIALLGCSIHSQYFPIAVFIFVAAYLGDSPRLLRSLFNKNLLIPLVLVTALFLVFIRSFLPLLQSFFSFIPGSEVAVAKLRYFQNAREVSRITSLMSIVVYPALLYIYFKGRRTKPTPLFYDDDQLDKRLRWIMIGLVFFGLICNLVFFQNSHVAGRLSRFSDYNLLAILVPCVLIQFRNLQLAILGALFFALLSPILFPGLYGTSAWLKF